MDAMTQEDLRTQVLELFKKKNKMMTSRDVAKALNLSSREAKKVLADLVNEGALEFTSYGGATFIKLPDES